MLLLINSQAFKLARLLYASGFFTAACQSRGAWRAIRCDSSSVWASPRITPRRFAFAQMEAWRQEKPNIIFPIASGFVQ